MTTRPLCAQNDWDSIPESPGPISNPTDHVGLPGKNELNLGAPTSGKGPAPSQVRLVIDRPHCLPWSCAPRSSSSTTPGTAAPPRRAAGRRSCRERRRRAHAADRPAADPTHHGGASVPLGRRARDCGRSARGASAAARRTCVEASGKVTRSGAWPPFSPAPGSPPLGRCAPPRAKPKRTSSRISAGAHTSTSQRSRRTALSGSTGRAVRKCARVPSCAPRCSRYSALGRCPDESPGQFVNGAAAWRRVSQGAAARRSRRRAGGRARHVFI